MTDPQIEISCRSFLENYIIDNPLTLEPKMADYHAFFWGKTLTNIDNQNLKTFSKVCFVNQTSSSHARF